MPLMNACTEGAVASPAATDAAGGPGRSRSGAYCRFGIAATRRRATSCVVRVSCSSRTFTPAATTPPIALNTSMGIPPPRTTAVCLPRHITCPVLTRVMRRLAPKRISEYTPQKRLLRSVMSPLSSVSQPAPAATARSFCVSSPDRAASASTFCSGTRGIPLGARWACSALRTSSAGPNSGLARARGRTPRHSGGLALKSAAVSKATTSPMPSPLPCLSTLPAT